MARLRFSFYWHIQHTKQIALNLPTVSASVQETSQNTEQHLIQKVHTDTSCRNKIKHRKYKGKSRKIVNTFKSKKKSRFKHNGKLLLRLPNLISFEFSGLYLIRSLFRAGDRREVQSQFSSFTYSISVIDLLNC